MTEPSVLPDSAGATLVARIRAGDRQAFEAMAEAYYERLVRYAYKYVYDAAAAEDIVQDVLLGVWMKRANLMVQTTVSSYLFGAVRNRALNHIRHRNVEERWNHQLPVEIDFGEWPHGSLLPPGDESNEDDALEQRVAAVRRAVRTLSPRQSEAFELRIEHGMSFAEVAEVMGISLRSAQTTYLRAVQHLRRRLAPYIS